MLNASGLPPLVSIQAFEAAARHGGFAAAARELGTTAASVSYHVKQLERQLGAPLFRRMAQRVALTEAGRIAAGEATAAFVALRGGLARARAADQSRLCVSVLPSFATAWLVPRLGTFRAAHSEVAISVDTTAEPRDLTAGEVDVAIRNGHGDWPGLRSVHLFPALFTPLCAPGLVEAAAAFLRLGQGAVPLLGRRDWWALWWRARGSAWRPGAGRFTTDLATEHLDIAAAIAGQGVAIGSPILFADDIDAGRLAMPHTLVAGDGRAFHVTYPHTRRGCAKIERFVAWVRDAAHDTVGRMGPALDGAVVLEPLGPSELPKEAVARSLA